MTELEAIQQAGELLGGLIFSGLELPVKVANPLLGLIGIASFFLGKRYEKKRQKKESNEVEVTNLEKSDF